MAKTALRLSLVIPVYNEEHHIKDCLEAIARQTTPPYEVLVVDNNSSDATAQIAASYPFVTVVPEARQGRGWARTAGFDAVTGDIIGRIDADSRIAPDWVARATQDFMQDPDLQGVTGLAKTVLFPRINSIKSKFWSRAYYWYVHASFRTITLWGADMAIRQSAWLQVRTDVCNDDRIVHEDQDISIQMAARGMKLAQDNLLLMETSGQTYNYLPKLWHYYWLERSTRRHLRQKGTLDSPAIKKLSAWSVLPGQLMAFLPGIYMTVASILWWPIDFVMIRLGKRKTWLD